jgi:hypothetical protein
MAKSKFRNTRSWNPFFGCLFNCSYCDPSFGRLGRWIGGMNQHCVSCKQYTPHEHPERLNRIPRDKVIHVCEDSDISYCSKPFMLKILDKMNSDNREGRVWLLQSKNPACLTQYLSQLPENTYLITTLETNRDELCRQISKAPLPSKRQKDFLSLNWKNKFVTVEPIMDFDMDIFMDWIVQINPRCTFIGYNSKPKAVQLPEPSMEKTFKLIEALGDNHINIMTKDMRGKAEKHAYTDFFEAPVDRLRRKKSLLVPFLCRD